MSHKEIRVINHGARSAPRQVVILPGLGVPSYVLPTASALAGRGLSCSVLDLPGFGSSAGIVCAPDIFAMGRAAAAWISELPLGIQVIVMGHSTGAQAALTAALEIQQTRPDAALVMAGPTFMPAQRRFSRLALATPPAYRNENLAEVAAVVPDLLRGHLRVGRIIASGMRDRPEQRLAGLRIRLVLTAGTNDTYAPAGWLDTLTRAAVSSPAVTTEVLPGSHNNPYTYPEELARLVDLATARDPRGR